MATTIDHIILKVNNAGESIAFYERILGFKYEGRDGPFAVLRVATDFTIQLVQDPSDGGEHYAFAMDGPEFEATFERVRTSGVPFGGSFDTIGSMNAPGEESGAQGMGKTVYFFDPSKHLIEIRSYAQAP